jgi:hypothetical protein
MDVCFVRWDAAECLCSASGPLSVCLFVSLLNLCHFHFLCRFPFLHGETEALAAGPHKWSKAECTDLFEESVVVSGVLLCMSVCVCVCVVGECV